MISNGCGASVGLEAGYAQIGAAIASRIGLALQLRRQDLRILVGCGAGGAIAAAFGAPLTGAFYASELIIGAYSLANAGPIFAAALAATLIVKALGGAPYVVVAPQVAPLAVGHHLALIGLGLISAALGVGAMRAAAVLERAFAASRAPLWARPVLGGLLVGAMALYTPQVLGAGHGALGLDFPAALSAATLIALIGLKLTASLVSLASGFRGGLFFASLFVGALLGKLYALGVNAALPALGLDPTACVLAGMGTLGVAIVGGPLTMTFLVLESTGDLGVAGGVLAACIATSLAVRATFGYSFTTWRLHLRGESIRGAQDVGWLRDLTVARLMVRAPPTTPAEATVRAFRAAYPLGSAHVVVAVDEAGRYRGAGSRARGARRSPRRRRGRRSDLGRRAPAADDAASRHRRALGAGDFRRRADGHARRHRARDRRRRRHAQRGLRRAPLRPGDEPSGERRSRRGIGEGAADAASPAFTPAPDPGPRSSPRRPPARSTAAPRPARRRRRFFCASASWRCVVEAGWMTSERVSPILATWENNCSLLTRATPAS